MVKTLMSGIAMVAANDETSLLQMFAGVRKSQGQRILAAVAEEGNDTICMQAAAGDVAPVTGSFTATMSQQAVVVAAGSVAGESGSFCVAKQDVLLIQRTFGLNTARDFEVALSSKSERATTTTTTMDWATFDFAGNVTKEVTVKAGECPSKQAGLVQNVEASVSDKQQEPNQLDADQLRVCACRNFLNSPGLVAAAAAVAANAAAGEVLLQRNFDAALASKKASTTTTTTSIDYKLTAEFAPLVATCTTASVMPWDQVAKHLNNPGYVPTYKLGNITGGWQVCDKSWVVKGACGEFIVAPAPVVATTVAPTDAATK
jgi:hypothetical protein